MSTNISASPTDILVEILWNFNFLKQELKITDAIVAFGTVDTSVARHAADLFIKNYAPLLIVSGGFGRLTTELFNRPEAEIFAEIAVKAGVPEEKILIENKATNTGENISFTKELLTQKNIKINSIIVAQKPYMLRRAYNTLRKQWPEMQCLVSAETASFEEYCLARSSTRTKENIINDVVGDMQRVIVYPSVGFTIPDTIPDEVMAAYEELLRRGYTKQLYKPKS